MNSTVFFLLIFIRKVDDSRKEKKNMKNERMNEHHRRMAV